MNHKSKIGILILILVAELALCFVCNLLFLRAEQSNTARPYRVDVSRVTTALENGTVPTPDEYTYITDIAPLNTSEHGNDDYAIAAAKDGTLYKISYRIPKNQKTALIFINLAFGLLFLFTVGISVYVYFKLLRPFRSISELPFELSKGNLTIPLQEEKSRYYGKFLWGMDLLRDRIETEKDRQLELEREKKTLILTLSHDIKTPISAIKLYDQALAKGLYDSEEKKQEAYAGIKKNAEELESYIEDIKKAVREDALSFKVENSPWYLSNVIDDLNALYKEKAAHTRTAFTIDNYDDCLLSGDRDRALEVLQNLMENAIKYGDGKEIHISFADEEDCRLVTVSNSGNTLNENEAVNIFDSFYRGSNASGVKGSGLGLYICRSLMRAMDGDIFAQIENNTFSVTAVFKKG